MTTTETVTVEVTETVSIIPNTLPNFIDFSKLDTYAQRDNETGQFHVANVLRDRRAGSVDYMKIFDATTNIEHISRKLVDEEAREAVATMLISRPFAPIFAKLFPTPTLKLDGARLVKTDVISAIRDSSVNAIAAEVITEMVLPILIELGVVSSTNRFTARHVYGYEIPRLADLQTDIIRQELEHLLADAKARVNLTSNRVYSTRVVADEFNEAFFNVGKRLRQLGDYTGVLDDFVKGVRAFIDPALTGLVGEISSDFVNRTEISILATNFNFIRAALELPVGSSIKTTCDDWKLDKWTPIVFALVRNSERYVMVGREEFCSGYDVRVVDDLRGHRRIALFTEAAQFDPVGMTVIGELDAEVIGAWNLDEPADKVGARLVATYDKLPQAMSTVKLAEELEDSIRAIVETGVDSASVGLLVNTLAITDAEYVIEAYAALISGRVSYRLSETGVEFIFAAKTTDKNYEPRSGYRDLENVYTASPAEAILVGDAKDATVILSSRPQLIAPHALNSRLLGMDEFDLLQFNQDASFKFDILGTKMQGRFSFSDLVSMKNGRYMKIVRPWFNATVAAQAFTMLYDLRALARSASGESPAVGARLTRDAASVVVGLAKSISRAFRQEIHDIMRSRSVAGMAPADAIATSAKLRQSSFAAIADCYALDIFLRRMGLTEDAKTSVYASMLGEPEFAAVISEYGSDRA